MSNESFITREKFISIANRLSNRYYPNPDDSDPIGPWGPIIRKAVRFSKWDRNLLNPQPLPPSIVREVVDRARLMHEITTALADEGNERGIIIVGGYISEFVDYCGNGRIKIPVPKKGPVPEPDRTMDSIDFIEMGLQFHSEARITDSKELQKVFTEAGNKLLEIGVDKCG